MKIFFFTVLYIIFGSVFLTIFYPESFWLTINGNNGFLGNLFENNILLKFVNLYKEISYYLLIFNPIINDFFWASKGRGAWHNNRRIRVSKRKNLV